MPSLPPDTVARAVLLLKEFEGLQLKAYRCPAGTLTVGWGHTGMDVKEGLVVSKEQAEALLTADTEAAARDVARLVCTPLSANEAAALVSFGFNVGAASLAESKLLRLLNSGHPRKEVAKQLAAWNKATVRGQKVELFGLTARRAREREVLCRKEQG